MKPGPSGERSIFTPSEKCRDYKGKAGSNGERSHFFLLFPFSLPFYVRGPFFFLPMTLRRLLRVWHLHEISLEQAHLNCELTQGLQTMTHGFTDVQGLPTGGITLSRPNLRHAQALHQDDSRGLYKDGDPRGVVMAPSIAADVAFHAARHHLTRRSPSGDTRGAGCRGMPWALKW